MILALFATAMLTLVHIYDGDTDNTGQTLFAIATTTALIALLGALG